jgi:hypothetical protein
MVKKPDKPLPKLDDRISERKKLSAIKYKPSSIHKSFKNEFQSKLKNFIEFANKEKIDLNSSFENMCEKTTSKVQKDNAEQFKPNKNILNNIAESQKGLEFLKLENLLENLDQERNQLNKFDERILKSMNNI